MSQRNLIFIAILLFVCTLQNSSNTKDTGTCLDYKAGTCIACPHHYHLFKQQCYKVIRGCRTYELNKFGVQQCLTCEVSISKSDGKGGCTVTGSIKDFEDSQYFHQGKKHQQGLRFYPMTISQARSNSFFKIANNFMLSGEYKRYICQTVQPVQFIGILGFRDEQRLKIIYQGNGGSLILCIFSSNLVNGTIQMIKLIQILPKNIINSCQQYDLTAKCLSCQSGYHLQNSICYLNIQNCISYYQNICLQCSGFALLIENRCMTNVCCENSDFSQIIFYGNHWCQSDYLPRLNRSYLLK